MVNTRNSSTDPTTWTVFQTLLSDMVGRYVGVRRLVAIGAGLEIVGVGLGVAGPFFLKLVVDRLDKGGAGATAVLCVGLFVAFWALSNVIATWRLPYSTQLIDRLTERYTTRAVLTSLPEAADGREGDSGRMMGLIERLPYSLTIVVDGLIWHAAPLVIQLIASLWLLAGLIPFYFAMILAVVLVAYSGATWLGAIHHQKLAAHANTAAASASEVTSDVIRNARRVVLNGTLGAEIGQIREGLQFKAAANRRMMWSLVGTSILQYGIVGIGLTGLLTMAVSDVLADKMTVGNFVLLQAYVFRLVAPLSGFGFLLSQASVSIANIRDILAFNSVAETDAFQIEPPAGAAQIVLEHVNFSYGPGLPGLHDISAVLEPGSFNVIVGPNGSGKSTLAQIIAGGLRPSSGEVTISGQNLATVARQDHHRFVLYVPQFIGLFNRSLSANALYPPSRQTEAQLAMLLSEWRFHDTGRAIDFGAIVGEQGERLSGGQIQKLELARIIGVKVPAIILDESTSALDPVSEEAVIRTLRSRFGLDTTLVLISHRQRLAEMADQVLFMKNGRLVRNGLHEYLLRDSAVYRQLWA
ncbi:ABC transporter ATP-binding protein [Asticcacaulis sp.]|uniref:ABC transporter ATP-binding protein n=1 Tax=Asticcacaulis sp. TaxID=1872648 RepID=UPI002CA20F3D|nr:ABC transporter ATP-binding protein [Asticcacaulis sp.]HTM81894.1 ABC transporter ATP-binding protein [Asticcacaulis sp.]